ncbi:MAG: dienelactone hydrolase family protein [Ignavibacteria bacterium]|nr:dienelactone hydrolase family protein [Ignavibacteria bacterium]
MKAIPELIAYCVLLMGALVSGVAQQDIRTTATLTDRRSAYDRAIDMLKRGADTAQAIHLLELWMAAVPFDTNAARILSTAYASRGMMAEASIARSIPPDVVRIDDSRVETHYTPQVRLGTYRVLLPKNYSPKKRYPAVLLLHGNGQGPNVMIDFARALSMDSVLFICPFAPYVRMQETKQSQRNRFSASGEGIDMPDSLMSEIVDESASWYRDAYTDASTKYSIARIKPIIVGFSQGGFYAHIVASRFPSTFQSVVSIGASMFSYGRFQEYVNNLNIYGIDALVLQGTHDNVVPLQTAELIVATLKNSGVNAELVTFEGEHWPTNEAIQIIRMWLQRRLR